MEGLGLCSSLGLAAGLPLLPSAALSRSQGSRSRMKPGCLSASSSTSFSENLVEFSLSSQLSRPHMGLQSSFCLFSRTRGGVIGWRDWGQASFGDSVVNKEFQHKSIPSSIRQDGFFGRISPLRTKFAAMEVHQARYSLGRNGRGSKMCRAQAASNLSMSDGSALNLPRVSPLPFVSERVKVAALVAFAMALCNADRVVMSIAILPLAAAQGWSTSMSGFVQSSFLWGYLASPIPAGMMADRYGGKAVMAWGVAIWSLATLATPWAANHSMAALLAVRIVMGAAEGVAMPCINNIICKWFPRLERARAIAATMAGFHIGSVAALLVSPGLIASHGVPGPFLLFGCLGVLWLPLWCPTVSKDPHSSQSITRSEYSYICRGQEQKPPQKSTAKGKSSGIPLALIFSKAPTWAIIVANAMNNWGYFVLLSWMPVYFNTVLGVNLCQAAWLSAFPWAMMASSGFVAGFCSDHLLKIGASITTVRKIMQTVGFVGPAAALLRLNSVSDPTLASIYLTAAVGLSSFSQAGFLVNHQEIAPNYAGFLHGVSNSFGTCAAIGSTVGTGYFIERLGSFQAFLTCTAVLYVLCAVHWICNASGERVID